jgi:hypothetical protein
MDRFNCSRRIAAEYQPFQPAVGLARAVCYDGGMDENPYESSKIVSPASEPQPPTTGLTAPQLFGAIVRGIGVYFLAVSVVDLMFWVLHQESQYLRGVAEYAVAGIIPFLFPNLFVRIAYRPGQD